MKILAWILFILGSLTLLSLLLVVFITEPKPFLIFVALLGAIGSFIWSAEYLGFIKEG